MLCTSSGTPQAIYAAVTAGQPPIRFQVGPDAVAMVEAKLTRVRDELEAGFPRIIHALRRHR